MANVIVDLSGTPELALAYESIYVAFDEGTSAVGEETDRLIKEVAAPIPIDWRSGKLLLPERDFELLPKVGGMMNTVTPSAWEYTVRLDPFAGRIRIEKRTMHYDKYGVSVTHARQAGAKVALRHSHALRGTAFTNFNGIRDGVTKLGPDGLTFFHTAHPVQRDDPGLATWTNKHALALTRDNYRTVRTAMFKAPDGTGRPRGLRPTHFLVGGGLESTAREIAAIKYLEIGGIQQENPDQEPGGIKIVVVPEFGDTEWMLCSVAGGGPMDTPFGYSVGMPFELVYRDLQQDHEGANYTWEVDGDDAVVFHQPWRAQYSKP